MPTAGGLDKALRRGVEIGCTAIQIFTSSPQQWKAKEYDDATVRAFRSEAEALGLAKNLVSHDSYLINLCAPNPELREKSIEGLTAEMERCGRLGVPFVVSHMGAHMGQGEEAGIAAVAESAKAVLAQTPAEVTLLMETTAGQGTSLNWRFEHLAAIMDAAGAPARLAVCLDTCHIFAAGYDIRVQDEYERTFQEFERVVGIDKIKVIHCNDSKKALGTRVDRHEHLGEGEIGTEAFRLLVNDPRFDQVPIVVETPEAETKHAENVARLWEWSGQKNPAR